jgi:hypothetical protein
MSGKENLFEIALIFLFELSFESDRGPGVWWRRIFHPDSKVFTRILAFPANPLI